MYKWKIENCILFDEINDYAIIFITVVCGISFWYLKHKINVTVCETYYKIIDVKEEIDSIVVAVKGVDIEKNSQVCGTGKNNFIVVKTDNLNN